MSLDLNIKEWKPLDEKILQQIWSYSAGLKTKNLRLRNKGRISLATWPNYHFSHLGRRLTNAENTRWNIKITNVESRHTAVAGKFYRNIFNMQKL